MAKVTEDELTEFIGQIRTVMESENVSLPSAFGIVANRAFRIFQLSVVLDDRLSRDEPETVALFKEIVECHQSDGR